MKSTIAKVILEEGMDNCQTIATVCNEEILKGGKLQKNNGRLWGEILHKFNNRDWATAVGVMRELMDTHPNLFDSRQEDAVLTADVILSKNWADGEEKGRILDTKAHKYDAWRLLMAIREVWNKAGGIDIPNDDTAKQQEPKPNLFEIQ